MGQKSEISWTEATFNPWVGCTKVSLGCDHCYAETLTKRTGFVKWGKDADRRVTSDDYWRQPLKWNAAAKARGFPMRVFCGSLCDVMEEREGLQPVRERLYGLIEQTDWLIWMLLTKRPQNFRRLLPASWLQNPRRNVWGMTTVESDDYHWRAWEILKTPFSVRGISAEPLLGPLDLDRWELVCKDWRSGVTIGTYLDFVICGGESGPCARPMEVEWVRTLRDQCSASNVAFHFKQWGGVRKKETGRELDGRTWDDMPKLVQISGAKLPLVEV